jgi:negative regulator of flagellin synthesis FlgM
MSYTNGIGNLQQALASLTSTSAKSATDVTNSPDRGASVVAEVQEDQASLSFTGGAMSQALGASDVRSTKVAALQQAIASGSYKVPSSDVAEKMIDSLLE